MTEVARRPVIFTSRLARLNLLDGENLSIGRVDDVVIQPAFGAEPPRVIGLVATVQRRHIFVNLGRVAEISVDGVHLKGGTVDLRRFHQRAEELLASSVYHRRVGDHVVIDVGIERSSSPSGGWEVVSVALGSTRTLRRRTTTVVPWTEHPELFAGGALAGQLASLRTLHPNDLADAVSAMPLVRRRQLADALEDEEIADLLEELPEADQVRFLGALDLERRADVVEEMEPDDAADLLAEMPADARESLLQAMDSLEAAEVRRLLRYDATTAGGLMTSQPLIASPEMPVAEVLARVRDPQLSAPGAATVYVCEPPITTPTGRFLGTVGFQRLLREAPAALVGDLIDGDRFVTPDLPQSQVAARLAAYDLVGLAVCDDARRLVGAVTVDDVLERLLPVGWRAGARPR